MIYLKDSKLHVTSPEDSAKVFQDILALEDRIEQEKEHYYVMHLNNKFQVLSVELITIGTLNSSLVHPRETFRRAIIAGAAAIIIAHNHPSGDPEPSDEDRNVTKKSLRQGSCWEYRYLIISCLGKIPISVLKRIRDVNSDDIL